MKPGLILGRIAYCQSLAAAMRTTRGCQPMPTHAEKRVVRYSADQMYRLIADVARYPDFLPWCSAARIARAPRCRMGRARCWRPISSSRSRSIASGSAAG